MDAVIGFTLSGLIAGVAFKKKSLSTSGFVSATILGTLLYAIDVPLFLIMMAFFLTSSLLSRWVEKKNPVLIPIVNKGNRRDITQVVANGGIPLMFAILYLWFNHEIFILGFISAFASANADTWASEIGSLSKTPPRFLFKHSQTLLGLSGGVTPLGFFASFLGSLWISLVGYLLYPYLPFHYFLLSVAAGFIGCTIDSILGELVQAKYLDDRRGHLTEIRFVSQMENQLVSGYHWIDNNMVNFLSVSIASVGSVLLLFLFM